MKENRVIQLFLSFLKIGAFTFGGGYAMIPLIQREVTEKKKWITDDDILEIVAISESTPGPIAINAATFVGYRVAGKKGAAAATIGVVLPSFVIISLISLILEAFKTNAYVQYAFYGIRAGVLALVIKALISMYKKCPKGLFSYIVMGAAFVFAALVRINVILVIAMCGFAGWLYSFIASKRSDGRHEEKGADR